MRFTFGTAFFTLATAALVAAAPATGEPKVASNLPQQNSNPGPASFWDITLYTETGFKPKPGYDVGFWPGKCTDIRPTTELVTNSVKIPFGFECTLWYDWTTCTGDSITIDHSVSELSLWPGSFKCKFKYGCKSEGDSAKVSCI